VLVVVLYVVIVLSFESRTVHECNNLVTKNLETVSSESTAKQGKRS
jgi:hypothetical protein